MKLLEKARAYSTMVEGTLNMTRTEAEMNTKALVQALHQVLSWRGFVQECNEISKWNQEWLGCGVASEEGQSQEPNSCKLQQHAAHKRRATECLVRMGTEFERLRDKRLGLERQLHNLQAQARTLQQQTSQMATRSVLNGYRTPLPVSAY